MMFSAKYPKVKTGAEILDAFIATGLFIEKGRNEFSRFPCDVCNSRLGGERWQIDGFLTLADAKARIRKYGLSVCRDCYDKLHGIEPEG